VWVKHATGYAARTEEADSPEEARATVQAFIDEAGRASLHYRAVDGVERLCIVGVQDYNESQLYNAVSR